MKKLPIILIIALILTSLSGCGRNFAIEPAKSTSEPTEPIILKLAFNQNEEHPQYIAMKAFGESLYEKTNGKYALVIFPNEQLGSQEESIEMVQSGTIAMALVVGSLLESLNPDYSIFDLPYIFKSAEHQRDIVNDPEIVGELYESTADKGIITLAAFHAGIRNVYTDVGPIRRPRDLNNLKLRVIPSDTNLRGMRLMGGTGVGMSQGEVYSAIQEGLIDGAENNELIYSSLNHVEVAPYYSYTKHLMLPDYLIINSDLWNELPEDVKQIFREELEIAVDYEYDIFADAVEAAKQAAVEAGAEFNEVDIETFQRQITPLTEIKITTDVTKDIYNRIRAWRGN
ncbi:TRAP transporter substrate-binding protein [Sedimentibacter sp. MB31-C6]|uniref:TRAP transporter substrate-binding protein n=1 Tax=Sedimentibacter sp. MB31-C6 TaxID=3109366 RepID=UPI002DDD456F|nr:TRAP transporter substrate-binding protein [Sedimentibacter sp. MB36-C1]WSI03552.1 TRAP transporter substrate-binding protein [Sedimentibacter sp. MB36-C1]